MEILVGHTGFVGSNIAAEHTFDGLYNSRNIAEAFGTKPDLLVYSGVPAEMFLANTNPDADLKVCENAAENIRRIAPKHLVLISSIAVLDKTTHVDEDYSVNPANLKPYGANRYQLELLARRIVPECNIIRLPALFGNGLKKNFIYDIINFVPAMLNKAKYDELSSTSSLIKERYQLSDNGFYKLTKNCEKLKAEFERIGFSALNFTNSNSKFQFYNLSRLWKQTEIAIKNSIPVLHTAVEPIVAGELYKYITGKNFSIDAATLFNYDYRTKYADLFNADHMYLFHKELVMAEIKSFIKNYSNMK